MSFSTAAIASLVESPNSVTTSPISLTFLPISAVYFTNSSTSALSAFVAIAALLASISLRLSSTASAASPKPFVKSTMPCLLTSMSLRLTSKASIAAWPAKARSPMSLSKLAIALLKPSLASFCSSNAALLAFTSLLMSLTTSAVFTSASLFSVTALVKSSRVSSCAAITPFKPIPSKSAFSTSSLVAVLIDLMPSLSVTTISSPSSKPLSAWAFSADASKDCSETFSKATVRPATPLLALSALSATASILEAASTALSAASLASFTLLSTLAESSVTFSSAALAEALAAAVSCSRVSTRLFTSALTFSMDSESSDEALEISLSTSLNLPEISSPIAVISSAIFLLLLAMVFFSSSTSWSTALSCSSKASSMSLAKLSTRVLTAVIPPAKPTPFMLSASISALVASRTIFLPSSLVATKLLPAAKPLTACSSSIVFNNRAELSLSKVNFPVSSSNLVFSPKTVWNAIAFCAFSGIEPKSLSTAPAALLTTAAATARLNAFTLNFFMFFTFLWWV